MSIECIGEKYLAFSDGFADHRVLWMFEGFDELYVVVFGGEGAESQAHSASGTCY